MIAIMICSISSYLSQTLSPLFPTAKEDHLYHFKRVTTQLIPLQIRAWFKSHQSGVGLNQVLWNDWLVARVLPSVVPLPAPTWINEIYTT